MTAQIAVEKAPPHFAYPFHFNAKGRSVTVEQDSAGDLVARAANVCVCTEGFREDLPEFGIPELLFKNLPLDVASVAADVSRWANLDASVAEHRKAIETVLEVTASL